MKTLADELKEMTQNTREKMYLQWKEKNVNTNFFQKLKEAANAGIGGVAIQCSGECEASFWAKWAKNHDFSFEHKGKEIYEIRWLT